MIPDKIYIGRVTLSSNEPGEQHLLPGWHKRPNPKITNTEYIRKDALMEWANKRLEEFRHIAEISNDVAADGEVDAFEELIDKLNEM